MNPADISVVIPAINESAVIGNAIESARGCGAEQIIVVDGGSSDETEATAQAAGADLVIQSAPGRGTQLNAGAAICDREVVLFLHADCELDPDCLAQICRLADPQWGAFRQRIESPRLIYRAIERGNALRVRLWGMPFGDQAVFVRRRWFDEAGRFLEIPLMEDFEFARRVGGRFRPHLLDGPVRISSRRWDQRGVIRQTLRNWSIQMAYLRGSPPDELARRYNRA